MVLKLCVHSQTSGTQALRPLTNKWIQLSVTFDPIIFIILLGIVVWLFGVHPFVVFFPIISILIIYYIIRFKMRVSLKASIKPD